MKQAHNEPASLQRVEIAWDTLVKIVVIVVATQLVLRGLLQVGNVVLMVVVGWIGAMGLAPLVDLLQRRYRIPRGVTVLGVYGVLLVLALALLLVLIPVLMQQAAQTSQALAQGLGQVRQLHQNYPQGDWENLPLAGRLAAWLPKDVALDEALAPVIGMLEQFSVQLAGAVRDFGQSLLGNAVKAVRALASGAVALSMVLIFTFLFTLEKERILAFVRKLVNPELREYTDTRLTLINSRLGAWVRGQLALCAMVGLAGGLIAWAVGLENTLLIGMLTALVELIPGVGLTLMPFIVTGMGLLQGPTVAVAALVGFVILNLVEGNYLVPKVMGAAVGVSPLVVIIALAMGAGLLGVIGMILSVPCAAAITVLVVDFAERHQTRRKGAAAQSGAADR